MSHVPLSVCAVLALAATSSATLAQPPLGAAVPVTIDLYTRAAVSYTHLDVYKRQVVVLLITVFS